MPEPNQIIEFVKSGRSLSSNEGKELILNTDISIIGEALLDSDEVFEQLRRVLRDNKDIGTQASFNLTEKPLIF